MNCLWTLGFPSPDRSGFGFIGYFNESKVIYLPARAVRHNHAPQRECF
jgi:hypothetical protein